VIKAAGEDQVFEMGLPAQPYPGLRSFEKSEWPIFFGREEDIAEAVDGLIEKQFLALYGESGCGKSSFVRAGVLPRLELDHGLAWRTESMLPRNGPLNNLAMALARLEHSSPARKHVVEFRRLLNLGAAAGPTLAKVLRRDERDYICILIDEFEEIFRLDQEGEADEVRQFVEVVVGLQRLPQPGLLTMRSEFIGACAHFEGLAEAFNATALLLPAMNRQALIRAVVEPARLFGGSVAESLAETLVSESSREQDKLPLMQHALMRMHRDATSDISGAPAPWILNLDSCRDFGGIKQILSKHADHVNDEIKSTLSETADIAGIVERLFKTLTETTAEGNEIRNPHTFEYLLSETGAEPEVLRQVLEMLAADGVSFIKRLSSPYEPNELVDVTHEALLRNWETLRIWMVEEFWRKNVKQDIAVVAQYDISDFSEYVDVAHRIILETRDLINNEFRRLNAKEPPYLEHHASGGLVVLVPRSEDGIGRLLSKVAQTCKGICDRFVDLLTTSLWRSAGAEVRPEGSLLNAMHRLFGYACIGNSAHSFLVKRGVLLRGQLSVIWNELILIVRYEIKEVFF
jgi:hypothetical protein